MADRYYEILPRIIGSKKRRRQLIFGVWALLAVSFVFPATGVLEMQSFVPADSEFFFVNIKMPSGTALSKTDETVKKAEDILAGEAQVVNYVSSVGSSLGANSFGGGGSTSESRASIQVNLAKKDQREEKSYDIVSGIRKKMEASITEGEVNIQEQESGPPSGSAVEVRVTGDDLEVLDDISTKIKNELAAIPTVIDAKISAEVSAGEIVFVPNKEILSQNGLTDAQVGAELRTGINGNTEESVRQAGDDIAISIGFPENKKGSIEEVKNIPIHAPSGKTLSVAELGEIKFASSLASIEHYDKDRAVSVTAGTDGGNPTEIANALKERIRSIDIPEGYGVDFGGESQDLQETFVDMFTKMIIGIILILFILIIQFNSYRQAAIILFTIPLAMIGVVWGMTLAGLTVDIPSFIGIVSLAGIVVNNAIILIDEMNRELASGKDLIGSARDAGRTRLRPVFLTTITTVFGLLPLSITQPDWRNMGFTIIFGLTFSTFLTLVVVPALYVSFYRKKAEV